MKHLFPLSLRYSFGALIFVSSIGYSHPQQQSCEKQENSTPFLAHQQDDSTRSSLSIEIEPTEFEIDLSNNPEFSSFIDNLDFFEKETTLEEFTQNLINLIVSILDNPNFANKEALSEYITYHLTKFVSVHNVTLNVSIKTAKKSAPTQEPDDETKVVIHNFADMVSSFFNIVKNPDCSQNVATNLTSMFANVVNIALLATKSKPLNSEGVSHFIESEHAFPSLSTQQE